MRAVGQRTVAFGDKDIMSQHQAGAQM